MMSNLSTPACGSVDAAAFFVASFDRSSKGLAHYEKRVDKKRGWRSCLRGLLSPARTPTRKRPHGVHKHNRNDRLGQSFIPGCQAPLDSLRRTEEVCGRLFLWQTLGSLTSGGRRSVS